MQFIDQKFTSVIKRWHLGWLTGSAFLLFSAGSLPAAANVTIIQEDFNDSTAYGWTVGGVGPLCLTAEGSDIANNVQLCDFIPDGTTFVPGSIQATIGTVAVGGNFLSPLAPLPIGNACPDQTNSNGAVTVNLGNIFNATGSNFGFIRFRVRID